MRAKWLAYAGTCWALALALAWSAWEIGCAFGMCAPLWVVPSLAAAAASAGWFRVASGLHFTAAALLTLAGLAAFFWVVLLFAYGPAVLGAAALRLRSEHLRSGGGT